MKIDMAQFILYVTEQGQSTEFYSDVLGIAPRLHVPGMTEFDLGSGAVLGLMPESGISRLLGVKAASFAIAGGFGVRAELYLRVDAAAACHLRALSKGAEQVSPLSIRTWGDRVAYCLDLDGYVLAFAERFAPGQTAAPPPAVGLTC